LFDVNSFFAEPGILMPALKKESNSRQSTAIKGEMDGQRPFL
jgi:hypothetical protein